MTPEQRKQVEAVLDHEFKAGKRDLLRHLDEVGWPEKTGDDEAKMLLKVYPEAARKVAA
jgi:hypothetical protein